MSDVHFVYEVDRLDQKEVAIDLFCMTNMGINTDLGL